jgi:hypothetical protein
MAYYATVRKKEGKNRKERKKERKRSQSILWKIP